MSSPGLSDMKGLGAAANKSLLLSETELGLFLYCINAQILVPEYILPIGGFEGEVPNGLVF